MRSKNLLASLFLLISSFASAEGGGLDRFGSLLDRILSDDLTIRKSGITLEQTEFDLIRAKSEYLPKLDVMSSVQRIQSFGSVPGLESLLLGGRKTIYNASSTVRFTWNLYAGGAHEAGVGLAKERQTEIGIQRTLMKAQTAIKLLEAYHAARMAQLDLSKAEIQATWSEKVLAQQQSLLSEGRVLPLAVAEAKVDLLQRESEVRNKRREHEAARSELAELFESAEAGEGTLEPAQYRDQLHLRGYYRSTASDVELADSRMRQATLELEQANALWRPRIDFFTTLTYSGLNTSGYDGAWGDQRKDKKMIGLSLTWNIFDGFSSYATVSGKKLKTASADLDMEIAVKAARRQLRDLERPLFASRNDLIVLRERLGIASAKVDVAQQKLDLGRGTSQDLLSASVERSLLGIDLQRAQETNEYLEAKALMAPFYSGSM